MLTHADPVLNKWLWTRRVVGVEIVFLFEEFEPQSKKMSP